MSYEEQRQYEERLRKTFLASADVLPERVSEYIRRVSERGLWDAKKQVLREYRPLVDHLTSDYVDYVINYLVSKPRRLPDGSYVVEQEALNEFGIQDNLQFFPPSPIHPPFLYLLNKDEGEGLRLTHELTNAATRMWRLREQTTHHGRPVKPLPIIINLPGGAREFWGSAEVYNWFRPNGNGPAPVSSALMALEMWMETQLERGRDPEELFALVLSGSETIATVAVCVGLALAYPTQCLRAALPLVSAPAIWDMDVARYGSDSMGSFKFDPFGNHEPIFLVQDERDKRPQRRVDIRNLAPHYVFSKEVDLRDSFIEAVRGFMSNLPFPTEEARRSERATARLQQRMEELQFLADRESYVFQEQPDGRVLIYPRQPAHIQERIDKELAPIIERNEWIRVFGWAQQTIKDRSMSAQMAIEDAVSAARSFEREGDFDQPFEGVSVDEYRRKAVVGVAAAVLIAGYEWAQEDEQRAAGSAEKGAISWSLEVLLAATRMTVNSRLIENRTRKIPGNPKVMAALGLGALAARGAAPLQVRQALLELTGDPHLEEVSGVFTAIAGSWSADPVLCWNCLSLALSLSLQPQAPEPDYGDPEWDGKKERKEFLDAEVKRREDLLTFHRENLDRGIAPPPPRIAPPSEITFLWDLAARAMKDLPLTQLSQDTDAKGRLIQLLDDALAWTIASNSPEDDEDGYSRSTHLYEWNNFIFDWAALLARSLTLEETRQHILDPVRGCWDTAPALTSDLQYQFIVHHLASVEPLSEKSHKAWREICGWVLESPEFDSRGRRRSGGEALSLVIFVRRGSPVLTNKWPHAASFTDVIARWVDVLGGAPRYFSNFLRMLEVLRKSFTPFSVLEWINRCSENASEPLVFWREQDNGGRTAALLQHIWNQSEESIRGDESALQMYSRIIDNLVVAGVPLASALQQKLERRG
jgi:hypothetical protein